MRIKQALTWLLRCESPDPEIAYKGRWASLLALCLVGVIWPMHPGSPIGLLLGVAVAAITATKTFAPWASSPRTSTASKPPAQAAPPARIWPALSPIL